MGVGRWSVTFASYSYGWVSVFACSVTEVVVHDQTKDATLLSLAWILSYSG